MQAVLWFLWLFSCCGSHKLSVRLLMVTIRSSCEVYVFIAQCFLHYLMFLTCIQTDVTSAFTCRSLKHFICYLLNPLLTCRPVFYAHAGVFVQRGLIAACNMQHCSQLHHIITLAHDAQGSLYATSHSHPGFFKSSRSISREVMGKAVACGCWFFISFSQFLSS